MTPQHHAEQLIVLFNQTFMQSHQTQLVCCEPEPIYRPADAQHPFHRIVFAHGFFASALHEISHWCIAGKARRLQEDFGYWYQPDGRSEALQTEFEQVEVKPQALEWLFSTACHFKFHFSADNLANANRVSPTFQQAVRNQALRYLAEGLPADAQAWFSTLQQHYRPNDPINASEFNLPQD